MVRFEYHTKVYYKDIDKMGVVYYARYLEFFEEARTELLNSIGFNYSKIEKDGYYLPVVSAHCDYRAGANYEDEITVIITLPELPRAKVKFEYEVLRDRDNSVLVTGYTVHGFTNHDGKPTRPPAHFLKTFADLFKGSDSG